MSKLDGISEPRRSLAIGLSKWGFPIEACVAALASNNDNLEQAAAAIVSQFGSPSKNEKKSGGKASSKRGSSSRNKLSKFQDLEFNNKLDPLDTSSTLTDDTVRSGTEEHATVQEGDSCNISMEVKSENENNLTVLRSVPPVISPDLISPEPNRRSHTRRGPSNSTIKGGSSSKSLAVSRSSVKVEMAGSVELVSTSDFSNLLTTLTSYDLSGLSTYGDLHLRPLSGADDACVLLNGVKKPLGDYLDLLSRLLSYLSPSSSSASILKGVSPVMLSSLLEKIAPLCELSPRLVHILPNPQATSTASAAAAASHSLAPLQSLLLPAATGAAVALAVTIRVICVAFSSSSDSELSSVGVGNSSDSSGLAGNSFGYSASVASEEAVQRALDALGGLFKGILEPLFDAEHPSWQTVAAHHSFSGEISAYSGAPSSSRRSSRPVRAAAGARMNAVEADDEELELDSDDLELEDAELGITNRMEKITVSKHTLAAARMQLLPVLSQLPLLLDLSAELAEFLPLDEAQVCLLQQTAFLSVISANANSNASSNAAGAGGTGGLSALALALSSKESGGSLASKHSGAAAAASSGATGGFLGLVLSRLSSSALSLLQTLFTKYKGMRALLLRELLRAHVRACAGRRFSRDFPLPLHALRPLGVLPSASSTSPPLPKGDNATATDAGADISAGAHSEPPEPPVTAAEMREWSVVGSAPGQPDSVSSITVLLLHLVHSVADLPSASELRAVADLDSIRALGHSAVEDVAAKVKQSARAKAPKRGRKARSNPSSGAEEAESPTEPLVKSQKGKELEKLPPTAGLTTPLLVLSSYCQLLVQYALQRLQPGSPHPPTADSDPKLLLQRFCEDLCVLLPRTEWPAAAHALFQFVRAMISCSSAVSTASATSVASSTTSTALTKMKKEVKEEETVSTEVNVTAAVTIPLSTTPPQLHTALIPILGVAVAALQGYMRAAEHGHKAIRVPPALPCTSFAAASTSILADASADLHDSAEAEQAAIMDCDCGLEAVAGEFHIACDVCHRWYHGQCVGVLSAAEEEFWTCDKCILRVNRNKQAKDLDNIINSLKNDGFDDVLLGAKIENDHTTVFDAVDKYISDEETFVFRSLILDYVTNLAYDNQYYTQARRFLIAKWSSEAVQNRNIPIRAYYSSQWQLPGRLVHFNAAASIAPPAALISKANLEFLIRRDPLFSQFDSLVHTLLSSSSNNTSKARASVMRSLSDLISIDPLLIRTPSVSSAVNTLLADQSKLVRSEALELVGKSVLLDPMGCLDDFLSHLLAALDDSGLAVRKRAVSVLRELLLRGVFNTESAKTSSASSSLNASMNSASSSASTGSASRTAHFLLLPSEQSTAVLVLTRLLRRLNDRYEDSVIRQSVGSLLRELWFSAPRLISFAGSAVPAGKDCAGDSVLSAARQSRVSPSGAVASPARLLCARAQDVITTRASQLVACVGASLAASFEYDLLGLRSVVSGKGTSWAPQAPTVLPPASTGVTGARAGSRVAAAAAAQATTGVDQQLLMQSTSDATGPTQWLQELLQWSLGSTPAPARLADLGTSVQLRRLPPSSLALWNAHNVVNAIVTRLMSLTEDLAVLRIDILKKAPPSSLNTSLEAVEGRASRAETPRCLGERKNDENLLKVNRSNARWVRRHQRRLSQFALESVAIMTTLAHLAVAVPRALSKQLPLLLPLLNPDPLLPVHARRAHAQAVMLAVRASLAAVELPPRALCADFERSLLSFFFSSASVDAEKGSFSTSNTNSLEAPEDEEDLLGSDGETGLESRERNPSTSLPNLNRGALNQLTGGTGVRGLSSLLSSTSDTLAALAAVGVNVGVGSRLILALSKLDSFLCSFAGDTVSLAQYKGPQFLLQLLQRTISGGVPAASTSSSPPSGAQIQHLQAQQELQEFKVALAGVGMLYRSLCMSSRAILSSTRRKAGSYPDSEAGSASEEDNEEEEDDCVFEGRKRIDIQESSATKSSSGRGVLGSVGSLQGSGQTVSTVRRGKKSSSSEKEDIPSSPLPLILLFATAAIDISMAAAAQLAPLVLQHQLAQQQRCTPQPHGLLSTSVELCSNSSCLDFGGLIHNHPFGGVSTNSTSSGGGSGSVHPFSGNAAAQRLCLLLQASVEVLCHCLVSLAPLLAVHPSACADARVRTLLQRCLSHSVPLVVERALVLVSSLSGEIANPVLRLKIRSAAGPTHSNNRSPQTDDSVFSLVLGVPVDKLLASSFGDSPGTSSSLSRADVMRLGEQSSSNRMFEMGDPSAPITTLIQVLLPSVLPLCRYQAPVVPGYAGLAPIVGARRVRTCAAVVAAAAATLGLAAPQPLIPPMISAAAGVPLIPAAAFSPQGLPPAFHGPVASEQAFGDPAAYSSLLQLSELFADRIVDGAIRGLLENYALQQSAGLAVPLTRQLLFNPLLLVGGSRLPSDPLSSCSQDLIHALNVLLRSPTSELSSGTPDAINKRILMQNAHFRCVDVPLFDKFYSECVAHPPGATSTAPAAARLQLLRKLVQRVLPDLVEFGSLMNASEAKKVKSDSSQQGKLSLGGREGRQLQRIQRLLDSGEGDNADGGYERHSAGGAPLSVGEARFLLSVILSLNFEKEEEPLTVVSWINCQAQRHADMVISALRAFINTARSSSANSNVNYGNSKHPASQNEISSFHGDPYVLLSFADTLTCALQAKQLLKARYGLSDAKVTAFDGRSPAAATIVTPFNTPSDLLSPGKRGFQSGSGFVHPEEQVLLAAYGGLSAPVPGLLQAEAVHKEALAAISDSYKDSQAPPLAVLPPPALPLVEAVVEALENALYTSANDIGVVSVSTKRPRALKSDDSGATAAEGKAAPPKAKKSKPVKQKRKAKRRSNYDSDASEEFDDDDDDYV